MSSSSQENNTDERILVNELAGPLAHEPLSPHAQPLLEDLVPETRALRELSIKGTRPAIIFSRKG